MPFAIIPQVPPSRLLQAADLRLAMHLNGKDRTPLLVAAFSSTALARAGLPLGSMLTLSRGSGPDDGKIQIGLGRNGPTRKLMPAGKKGAGTVRFTIPDGWLRPSPAAAAEIEFGARRAVIALLPPELLLSIPAPLAAGDPPPGVEKVAITDAALVEMTADGAGKGVSLSYQPPADVVDKRPAPDGPLVHPAARAEGLPTEKALPVAKESTPAEPPPPAAEGDQEAAAVVDEGQAPAPGEEEVPKGAKYTAGEKRTALALLGAGSTGREVAHELGLDLSIVSEWAANQRLAKAAKGRRAA